MCLKLIIFLSACFGTTLAHFHDPSDFFGLGDIIGDRFNKTLQNITHNIDDIHMEEYHVLTGQQEFGNFELNMTNVKVTGLNAMYAEVIDIKVLPPMVKNITLVIPKVILQSENYSLLGEIIFPIGGQIMSLTGSNGKTTFEMDDLRMSVYLKPHVNLTGVFVKDLTLETWASNMNMDFENILGGGRLGNAFNTVLNDTAIVAYDYYKGKLTDYYIEDIKALINSIMCRLIPFCKPEDYFRVGPF